MGKHQSDGSEDRRQRRGVCAGQGAWLSTVGGHTWCSILRLVSACAGLTLLTDQMDNQNSGSSNGYEGRQKKQCCHCLLMGHLVSQCKFVAQNCCHKCNHFGHDVDQCLQPWTQSSDLKRKGDNTTGNSSKHAHTEAQNANVNVSTSNTNVSTLNADASTLNADASTSNTDASTLSLPILLHTVNLITSMLMMVLLMYSAMLNLNYFTHYTLLQCFCDIWIDSKSKSLRSGRCTIFCDCERDCILTSGVRWHALYPAVAQCASYPWELK